MRASLASKRLPHRRRSSWRYSLKLRRVQRPLTWYWPMRLWAFFPMMSWDSAYAIFSQSVRYWSWFMFKCCLRLCSQAFKQSLSSSYSAISGSFSDQWVTEAVACNSETEKLTTEDRGRGYWARVWATIWTIMVVRAWGSRVIYVGEDWFDDDGVTLAVERVCWACCWACCHCS